MIDSEAATYVCPIWFASTTQTYDIPEQEKPNLRTATEDPMQVYGYKWGTWPMRATNRWRSRSMCARFHNQYCQKQDWQNKASQSTSVSNQQSHIQTGLKQNYEQRKEHTSYLWTTQEHYPTTSLTSTTRNKESKQQYSPSPWHDEEHNGWHTNTTFGHTTIKDTWWDSTKPSAKQHTRQTKNVQFRWTSLRMTEEQ